MWRLCWAYSSLLGHLEVFGAAMLDHVQAFKTQAKGSNEQGSTILVSSIGEINLKGFLHPTQPQYHSHHPKLGISGRSWNWNMTALSIFSSNQLKSSGIKSRSESEWEADQWSWKQDQLQDLIRLAKNAVANGKRRNACSVKDRSQKCCKRLCQTPCHRPTSYLIISVNSFPKSWLVGGVGISRSNCSCLQPEVMLNESFADSLCLVTEVAFVFHWSMFCHSLSRGSRLCWKPYYSPVNSTGTFNGPLRGCFSCFFLQRGVTVWLWQGALALRIFALYSLNFYLISCCMKQQTTINQTKHKHNQTNKNKFQFKPTKTLQSRNFDPFWFGSAEPCFTKRTEVARG